MRSEAYSLAYVDGMIDYLEKKIETNSVTETLLGTMQKWLDTVEDMYRETEQYAEYYAHLLELQTLIYGENKQENKALEFMKEAVRQAGGVSKLYSGLLREYIARTIQKPVAETVVVPQTIPLAPEPVAEPVDVPVAEMPEQPAMPLQEGFADLSDITERRPAKHAAEYHNRSKLKPLKVAFAAVFALAIVGVAVAKFVPQTGAVSMMVLKHDEITRAKDHFESLTAQYDTCSAKLADLHNSVDTADDSAVNAYNQETTDCQSILNQQHNAADVYNHLIGKS